MPKISGEIKEFLEEHLAFVATVDSRGMPNVVPKGAVSVLGGDYLVFADLYAHQTKKNLGYNPHIAIVAVNPAGYKGYQIKGKARIIERGKEFDRLLKEAAQGGQLRHPDAKYAIKVKVDKVIDIGYGDNADRQIY